MFTGIVAAVGEITEFSATAEGAEMTVRSPILKGVEVGASVSVDGCCLTVTSADSDTSRFGLHNETLAKTTHAGAQVGGHVNLERALRLGDELGGHLVSGHIDATGEVTACEPDGKGIRLTVAAPGDFLQYCVPKGSVTVDGVSLTITDTRVETFSVAVIEHTLAVTTIGGYTVGRKVNLEADMIAKYLQRLTQPHVSQ